MPKPGGLIYVSTPVIFPYHADPDEYYRFSMSDFKILCESFEEIQCGFNRGPASTFCHLLVHFSAILFSLNSRRLYGLLVDFFTWSFFWIKYFDRWLGHYKVAKVMHGSAFFFGRKTALKTNLL